MGIISAYGLRGDSSHHGEEGMTARVQGGWWFSTYTQKEYDERKRSHAMDR